MVGSPACDDDPKMRALLEAAASAFLRHGYRKTSMDEVARAANVSRQGLYLHFATKEALFRAAAQHVLGGALEAARAALCDPSPDLEGRLVRAFDAWYGGYAGTAGAPPDLHEAGGALVGPLIAEHEALFADAVAKALRGSGLAAAYKPAGLTAKQLADTLHATARGLKHASPSREVFVQGVAVAVRALCLPLACAT
jgi:TetR/AcrR family transcriptional regulator, regulator of autoinduction and epiphytic fitness